jgi:hypothetical protein
VTRPRQSQAGCKNIFPLFPERFNTYMTGAPVKYGHLINIIYFYIFELFKVINKIKNIL